MFVQRSGSETSSQRNLHIIINRFW